MKRYRFKTASGQTVSMREGQLFTVTHKGGIELAKPIRSAPADLKVGDSVCAICDHLPSQELTEDLGAVDV